MKKLFPLAITFCLLSACYAPLNNSGVSTNKSWLDVPAKKTDFDGKQFDSCYQFQLDFIPEDAAETLDLRETCIEHCCWRSDKTQVVLDFNKNFEKNLAYYGRANKYSPEKITLQVSHSNLVNTTSVKVSPQGAIKNNGIVKLKKEVVENPSRLAQIESQARMLQTRRNAWKADQQALQQETLQEQEKPLLLQRAKELVQRKEGTRIDRYFYQLDKSYKKKGSIFLLSQRIYTASFVSENIYKVKCHAQTQTGSSAEQLQQKTVSCGTWKANLEDGTVSPADNKSRLIKTNY